MLEYSESRSKNRLIAQQGVRSRMTQKLEVPRVDSHFKKNMYQTSFKVENRKQMQVTQVWTLQICISMYNILVDTRHSNDRSSHWRCSVKKVSLEISQNSRENTCARVSFLIKLLAEAEVTLLTKGSWHRCFPVNFVKFLRTPFLTEHLRATVSEMKCAKLSSVFLSQVSAAATRSIL